MRVTARTDVGVIRENNEDFLLIDEAMDLFIVSDGMGGYQAGEIASEIAAKTIMESFNKNKHFNFEADIDTLLIEANEAILTYVKEHVECRGMGTTVVVAHLAGDDLWVANVGDSRCYGLTTDSIKQLSEDHSLVAELVKIGSISAEEAENHPDRNVITSALGVDRKFEIFKVKYRKSDFSHILLCSDGLSNMVSSKEVLEVFKRVDFDQIPKVLVDSANAHGGKDNITVVCVEL